MSLCIEKRGQITNQTYLTPERVELNFDMPLAEIVFDFEDLGRDKVSVAGGEFNATKMRGTGSVEMKIVFKKMRVESDWVPGNKLAVLSVDGTPLILQVGKVSGGFRIRNRGADIKVHVRSPRQAELAALMPEKLPPDASKMLLCPMPGLIVKVDVEEGDEVQEGQALATVEAMKMENVLRAEKKGTVSKINAGAGDSLAVDAVIMEFE